MKRWSDSDFETLRTLRSQGLSSNKIAARMGMSRSAVVGKLHREMLQVVGSDEIAVLHEAAVTTLPEPVDRVPLPPWDPSELRPASACCWPSGEGRGMTFRGARAVRGKPYCSEHVGHAYLPKRHAA